MVVPAQRDHLGIPRHLQQQAARQRHVVAQV